MGNSVENQRVAILIEIGIYSAVCQNFGRVFRVLV